MGRPNILFICSDQHRFDCIGANGHPLAHTPNLDRLAREGANFTQAYTPLPMCVPTRCSLLCGQWPTQHGAIFNFDAETFKPLDPALPMSPAVVRDAGYHTVYIGHWHVDPQRLPTDFGFHDYVPEWRYGKWRAQRGLPPPAHGGWNGVDTTSRPAETALAWGADQVIGWIERMQDYAEPFFLQWHTVEPHMPCFPPEPYASMYDPARLPPWPGCGDMFEDKPYIQKQRARLFLSGRPSWRAWAPFVAHYLGVVSLLDFQIGRVLDALDRLGLARDTLVIYTSDHGEMAGSHGMGDKHYIMYDDVVRVPLLMRWPGEIPAGRVTEEFASSVIDGAATFCAAAGVPAPASFVGVDLLPAARGAGGTGRTDIFASYHGNQFGGYSQRMVRDRRWKYVWNATDVDELYDLATDPGELRNRVHDASCAAELARLRGRLVAWMKETRDPLANPSILQQLSEGNKR